ncbi:MAG: ribonuclease [Thermoplasmata archaeon]|nr:ribonuclease [Thermoplasmata archaeon]MEA3165447.1 ribonuclease [Thermoplasmata archaeon]
MSSNLSVTFLGTGASWPTAERGSSAIAVKRGGEILLWDCGEGTQRQIQKSGLSYQQVTQIWLTHYHGDHCYGVPGLLKTMALNERTSPLWLYGPRGLARMVAAWRELRGWPKEFPIHVLELKPGDVVERDGYTVTAYQGDHGIDNLAFALQEPDRPGFFDKPKALALGIPEGPLFGRLQRGETVTTKDGRTFTPGQVLGAARPGRRIVYSGDTQPCLGVLEAAVDADLFICEATYTQDLVGKARENRHMTAAEAAALAAKAKARKLVLTHISPRHKDSRPVLDEAKAVFPHVEVADDFFAVEVPVRGDPVPVPGEGLAQKAKA